MAPQSSEFSESADPSQRLPPDRDIYIENEKGQADDSFIDDLIASNAMKSYILSFGHDLEEEIIADLNRLYSIFRSDIEAKRSRTEGAKSLVSEKPDISEVGSQDL